MQTIRMVFACIVAGHAAVACGPALAQVYKWTDERGVVTYGEKPPANVRARALDIHPQSADLPAARTEECHTITCQADRLEADRRRRAERELIEASAQRRDASPATRGMGFDTYVRIRSGMSEGEVVQRAGRPDYEAADSVGRGLSLKSWYYYPTSADPFTTIVTLRGGRVAQVERNRQF